MRIPFELRVRRPAGLVLSRASDFGLSASGANPKFGPPEADRNPKQTRIIKRGSKQHRRRLPPPSLVTLVTFLTLLTSPALYLAKVVNLHQAHACGLARAANDRGVIAGSHCLQDGRFGVSGWRYAGRLDVGLLSVFPNALIEQMSGQYKIAWLCEALLVSRSGYYDWKERQSQPRPRQMETARLRERICQEFIRSRRSYGSPRLAHALSCPGSATASPA